MDVNLWKSLFNLFLAFINKSVPVMQEACRVINWDFIWWLQTCHMGRKQVFSVQFLGCTIYVMLMVCFFCIVLTYCMCSSQSVFYNCAFLMSFLSVCVWVSIHQLFFIPLLQHFPCNSFIFAFPFSHHRKKSNPKKTYKIKLEKVKKYPLH